MRLITRLLPLLAGGAVLPSLATTTTSNSILTLEGTLTATTIRDAATPTGDYISYSSTITLSNSQDGNATVTPAAVSGNSTTTSASLTLLVGGNNTANATQMATPTASSSPIVNVQPCNGYAEFCNRSYSNITMVAAHNSPFIKLGNIAANQDLDVTSQLNDGIRMLQFQAHLANGTMYLCHTSCDLLNAGTLTAYLTTVAQWMRAYPYDVVTILIGNYDYVAPGNFTAPMEDSGLMDLVYTPPKIPMALEDWPTLSSMIMSGKRAVVFMDYQANQTEVPWLMDEFSQMWETPFSPTDRAFPCTVQRPPGLSTQDAQNRMYLANHNLNLDVNIASFNLLIPNSALLYQTNAVSGYGSLGLMAENCTAMWDRPPNFLLVDYYNYGNVNGSVFEVAAEMNNVTYNGKCCGTTSAAPIIKPGQSLIGMLLAAVGVQFLASIF